MRFQQSEETSTLQLCAKCHKSIPDISRQGSLTQWIFRFDTCKCENPVPTTQISSRPVARFEQEPDDGAEPEFPVNPDQFPIERYKPLAQLGRGASGVVYLVRDRLLKKKVALKILSSITAEQLMSFQEEAKLTSKLDHKNIIRVLDFGPTSSGVPYMVLEYSDRVLSMAHSIRENGPLTVELAVEVFSRIADALASAHAMGIFHRDLKPSNILFTYSEEQDVVVKLIDFGVATVRKEALEPTQSTTVVGTLGYMAPELAANRKFDVRCEVYSLGCVLFESLTGRLPFVAETPLEMLSLHTRKIAPALSSVARQEFPRTLEELVEDCLAKEPDERPQSMTQFKERLASVLARSTETSAVVPPAEPEAKKSFPMQTALIVLGCIVTIAVVAPFFIAQIQNDPEKALPKAPDNSLANIHRLTDTERSRLEHFSFAREKELEEKRLADQIYGSEYSLRDSVINENSFKDKVLPEVTRVRITNCRIEQPAMFSKLENFPKLKNLDIVKTTGMSDVAMNSIVSGLRKHLSLKTAEKAKNRLEKPLFVNLADSDVDFGGLQMLEDVPSIVGLSLAGTSFSDNSVGALKALPRLQALDVSRTSITERGVKELCQMKTLLVLKVNDCKLGSKFKSQVIGSTSVVVEPSSTEFDDEFQIYYQAAQLDNVSAISQLASLYYLGKGVDRDFDEALKWYKKAALLGNAGSQRTVGTFYKMGLVGKKKDLPEALKWYGMAMKQGDAASFVETGLVYDEMENYKEAVKYLKPAAEDGVPRAQAKLGEILVLGETGPPDKEGLKWYQKAMDQGYTPAFAFMALAYQHGYAVERNDKQAFRHFSIAAEKGHEQSMFELGRCYLFGQGVGQDNERALHWFNKAADAGFIEAKTSIGFMHEKGLGVNRDYAEALRWYRDAAKGGDGNAMLAIGDFYRDGRGVPQDMSIAKTYYRQAAAHGSEDAKRRLGL